MKKLADIEIVGLIWRPEMRGKRKYILRING